MRVLRYIGKFAELGKSTKAKQRAINVSEVFHLWNHLTQRYSVLHVTGLLESFVKDDDFRVVLNMGSKVITNHVKLLEKEVLNYGIPLPPRPPKQTLKTVSSDLISDRYVYRRILRGIQAFLPVHNMAFINSTSPKIRDLFMSFMTEEMKIYDRLLEYGKLKEYLLKPPVYKLK